MILRSLLLSIYLALYAASASALQLTENREVNYSSHIKMGRDMTLHLDETTVHPWVVGSCFQYVPELQSIAYLNRIDSSIKLFNKESGEIKMSVPLHREGPDAVGSEPTVFYWLNSDSIFVFSNFNNGRLSLINNRGEKIRTYELSYSDDDLAHTVEISEVSGGLSYSKKSNSLFIGMRVYSLEKMLNRAPYLKLNIKSGEVKRFVDPMPYKKESLSKIPLDQRFTSVAVAINDSTEEVTLNFPLSSDLWVRKEPDPWRSLDAQSVYFEKPVFLKNNLLSYRNDREKYKNEVILLPRYTGLIHDPYKNVYYRISRLPLDGNLYERRLRGEKIKIYQEFSIQVFDDNWRKIAEDKFLDKEVLFTQGMFVDEDGLWLLRPQAENEDIMEFRLMNLNR